MLLFSMSNKRNTSSDSPDTWYLEVYWHILTESRTIQKLVGHAIVNFYGTGWLLLLFNTYKSQSCDIIYLNLTAEKKNQENNNSVCP